MQTDTVQATAPIVVPRPRPAAATQPEIIATGSISPLTQKLMPGAYGVASVQREPGTGSNTFRITLEAGPLAEGAIVLTSCTHPHQNSATATVITDDLHKDGSVVIGGAYLGGSGAERGRINFAIIGRKAPAA